MILCIIYIYVCIYIFRFEMTDRIKMEAEVRSQVKKIYLYITLYLHPQQVASD
jgi:hypothetical protein